MHITVNWNCYSEYCSVVEDASHMPQHWKFTCLCNYRPNSITPNAILHGYKFDPCTDIDTAPNMKDSSSSNERSTPFFLLKVLLFSLLSSLLNGSAKSWNHHYCQLLSMMSVIGLLPWCFGRHFCSEIVGQLPLVGFIQISPMFHLWHS